MSPQKQFEELLKNSPHFADVANTTRTAAAETVTAFLDFLIHNKQITLDASLAVLQRLDKPTGRPSVDSTRRFMVATIRDSLQRNS